jgi:hypothetical protein
LPKWPEVQVEQSRASRGKGCQPLEEPGAEQEHCTKRLAKVAPGQRPKQREEACGHQPQSGQCLTPFNEGAEEYGVGHNEFPQEGDEEAWQVPTTRGGP